MNILAQTQTYTINAESPKARIALHTRVVHFVSIIACWVLLCVVFTLTGPAFAEDASTETSIIGEGLADVILYRVFKPHPGTGPIRLLCIDADGYSWYTQLEETLGTGWPISQSEILDILKTRRDMDRTIEENILGTQFLKRKVDQSFLRSLRQMVSMVPEGDGEPRKTGVDIGEVSIYALKTQTDGTMVPVLLGMAGSSVYENPDPMAQMMYHFMEEWSRNMAKVSGIEAQFYALATEAIAPLGFQAVTVQEFFHLEKEDLDTATITALNMDCEEGPIEVPLTLEQTEQIRSLALRGIIVIPWDCWNVTGGTMVYVFRDAQGHELGSIETYDHDTLAVAGDGMYVLSLLPLLGQ